MPPTLIDADATTAIRRHWQTAHGAEIPDDAIAIMRPGPAARGVQVRVTLETPDSPSWFRCLACRPGRRDYRADVGADPLDPPARHRRAIARHFAEYHGIGEFDQRQIYHGTDDPVLCSYEAATPSLPAHLNCSLCPETAKRHQLDEAPYGDARSYSYLGFLYPDQAQRIGRLDPEKQAVHWEAHFRGVELEATHAATVRAVRDAKKPSRAPRLTPTQLALQAIMLDEVRRGENITDVIAELADLGRRDQVAYADYVARHLPSMEPYLWNPPEGVAELLVALYGRPARTARQLWNIWEAIPEALRADAKRSTRQR